MQPAEGQEVPRVAPSGAKAEEAEKTMLQARIIQLEIELVFAKWDL